MPPFVRPLRSTDLAAYRTIRMRALREHPEAFGSTAEAFAARSDEDVSAMLTPAENGDRLMFGAFWEEILAGLAMFARPDNPKIRHRASLFQMYVVPEARSRGLGLALVEAAVTHARPQPGLEELRLAVMSGNENAERLYRRCGFRLLYTDPRYVKIGERYYDSRWMSLDLHPVQRGATDD